MTEVGLVLLVSGVCSAAAQLLGGALSDTFGRRPLLLGAMAAALATYLVMALLIGFTAPVASIILTYVVARSALISMRPASQAMIVDLCPRNRLLEAYGLVRVGQNLGFAMGPALGGFLLVALPYGWLFGLATVVCGLTLFLIFRFIKETLPGAIEWVSIREVFSAHRNRLFLWFTILSVLVFLVGGQFTSTLSVFTVDRLHFSTGEYGFLLTTNGLLVFLFQYPMTRLISRFSRGAALISGALLYGIGFLSLGFVHSFGLAIGAMVIITLGEVVFAPTTLAVVGELSPEAERGRYQGFYGLSETIGLSLGPLFGGMLLDSFPDSNLSVWGGIALVSVVATASLFAWWSVARRQLTAGAA